MRARHKAGDRVQGYRVERVLGEGGQGVVYLARHMALGMRVAMKALFEQEVETRQHFLWQAQLLVQLSHPALPKVTDFFTAGGSDYLVMEYIEGQDLQSVVQAYGPQAPRQVVGWAARVLDGLGYLHGQPRPIIHRDIKPSNLKLTPAGRLYLVDFGLAKVGGQETATRVGAQGHTEGFSPPEQYSVAHTDARSDLYALGATLYFLLTGVAPPDATLRASGEAVVPLRARNSGVSPELEHWVMKALALRRDERWPSAAAMYRALPEVHEAPGTAQRRAMTMELPGAARWSPPRVPSSQPRRGGAREGAGRQAGAAQGQQGRRSSSRVKRQSRDMLLVGLISLGIVVVMGSGVLLAALMLPPAPNVTLGRTATVTLRPTYTASAAQARAGGAPNSLGTPLPRHTPTPNLLAEAVPLPEATTTWVRTQLLLIKPGADALVQSNVVRFEVRFAEAVGQSEQVVLLLGRAPDQLAPVAIPGRRTTQGVSWVVDLGQEFGAQPGEWFWSATVGVSSEVRLAPDGTFVYDGGEQVGRFSWVVDVK